MNANSGKLLEGSPGAKLIKDRTVRDLSIKDLLFTDSERNLFSAFLEPTEPKLEPWKILVVDDEVEVHQVTRLALQHFVYENRSLTFLFARTSQEALALIREQPDIAVILLDVVMETPNAGLALVQKIRDELNNKVVRIILRTGQPGEAPEEAIIYKYDINDYRTKTELTRQRLCTAILISLRAYQHIKTLEMQREELATLMRNLAMRSEELRRAKDMVEAANHVKSEFLAIMNHELRTPLNVILMRAEILMNGLYGTLTSRQLGSLEQVRNSGLQLLAIIDDILELVGIENGKIDIQLRHTAVKAVCELGLHTVQAYAEKKEIQVEFSCDENLFVMTDEYHLVKVLEKLLKNAIKFTPNHGRVGIRVTPDVVQSTFDNQVKISVWDTGIGIAADDMKRLFQPFIQLESSLTRRFEGAGLGLAIAARLTQMMGGQISVDSMVGRGSSFTVILPIQAGLSQTATLFQTAALSQTTNATQSTPTNPG